MKKLIERKKTEEVVYFDELKSGDIVGVIFETGNKGVFLHQYHKVTFMSSKDAFLVDTTSMDISDIFKYYKFDSMKELFKWLAE